MQHVNFKIKYHLNLANYGDKMYKDLDHQLICQCKEQVRMFLLVG